MPGADFQTRDRFLQVYTARGGEMTFRHVHDSPIGVSWLWGYKYWVHECFCYMADDELPLLGHFGDAFGEA